MLLAREAGVEVIGDIELFCRERRRHAPDAPFVAITGTNGKSTTTALIAHLMKVAGYDTQMGGNIGTAILSLEPPRMGRVHVIEMSSYQIDLTPSLDPAVGILLNISEDHIDRHGTLEHYAAVKERLVAGVQTQGTAIVGVDDIWCRDIADRLDRAGKRVVRISVRIRWQTASMSSARRSCRRPAARAARSRGSAASARCAACTMRRTRPVPRLRARARRRRGYSCKTACAAFPGLAHRMEQVGRRGSVLFVNDSKGTNADAAAHALSSFADIFWIAGGKPKAGGITGLAEFFPRIRKAYLIGEAAQEFAGTLGNGVPHEISRDARCRRGPTPRAMRKHPGCRARGAVVAGLRILRPVPQFRNPRRQVPRSGECAAGREAGGVRAGVIPGRCEASSNGMQLRTGNLQIRVLALSPFALELRRTSRTIPE